jgi:HPr kinase/phosphorylase
MPGYAALGGGDVAAIDHDAREAGMGGSGRQGTFLPGRRGPDCIPMQASQRVHGSCASRDGDAVLVIGPPGSGKSDLILRLIGRGFDLVADDQVDIAVGIASPPAALAGLLEARGLGIVRCPYVDQARLALVVELGQTPERLPVPTMHASLGVPLVHLDGSAPSAADRVILALNCALGRIGQVAGAFAA